MAGSHEVRGSIPLCSTKHSKGPISWVPFRYSAQCTPPSPLRSALRSVSTLRPRGGAIWGTLSRILQRIGGSNPERAKAVKRSPQWGERRLSGGARKREAGMLRRRRSMRVPLCLLPSLWRHLLLLYLSQTKNNLLARLSRASLLHRVYPQRGFAPSRSFQGFPKWVKTFPERSFFVLAGDSALS